MMLCHAGLLLPHNTELSIAGETLSTRSVGVSHTVRTHATVYLRVNLTKEQVQAHFMSKSKGQCFEEMERKTAVFMDH